MFLAGIALAAGLLQAANAQNCSDYTFVNHFNSSSEWKTNFERTSSTSIKIRCHPALLIDPPGRGLGLIKAAESGEGNTFTITTSEAGSVTLRSYGVWPIPLRRLMPTDILIQPGSCLPQSLSGSKSPKQNPICSVLFSRPPQHRGF